MSDSRAPVADPTRFIELLHSGEKAGKVPETIGMADMKSLGRPERPLAEIRANCVDCSGAALVKSASVCGPPARCGPTVWGATRSTLISAASRISRWRHLECLHYSRGLCNQMSSTSNKTGRSKAKLQSFVAIERYVMKSEAWRSLSANARAALVELLYFYTGANNGSLAMSARTLSVRIGVSKATAARVLEELQDRGFIEPVRPGGFNVKSGRRRSTEWRVTWHFCDVTRESPSKNFMRWSQGRLHLTVSTQSQPGLTSRPLGHVTKQDC